MWQLSSAASSCTGSPTHFPRGPAPPPLPPNPAGSSLPTVLAAITHGIVTHFPGDVRVISGHFGLGDTVAGPSSSGAPRRHRPPRPSSTLLALFFVLLLCLLGVPGAPGSSSPPTSVSSTTSRWAGMLSLGDSDPLSPGPPSSRLQALCSSRQPLFLLLTRQRLVLGPRGPGTVRPLRILGARGDVLVSLSTQHRPGLCSRGPCWPTPLAPSGPPPPPHRPPEAA